LITDTRKVWYVTRRQYALLLEEYGTKEGIEAAMESVTGERNRVEVYAEAFDDR
jgi:hypothetical protein